MSAVERISNYLNARAKIRQFDQAYIHWINECADSEAVLQTSDIVELLQQHAKMLDALTLLARIGSRTKFTTQLTDQANDHRTMPRRRRPNRNGLG